MRILVILLVSALLSSFGVSYADSISSTLESKKIYVFAQIKVQDSSGQLVGYLEVKKITVYDLAKLNQLLDQSADKVEKNTIVIDGKNYEMIKGTAIVTHSYPTVVSKNIISNNESNLTEILVEADHDGYTVVPGDKVTTTWTIIRPVS